MRLQGWGPGCSWSGVFMTDGFGSGWGGGAGDHTRQTPRGHLMYTWRCHSVSCNETAAVSPALNKVDTHEVTCGWWVLFCLTPIAPCPPCLPVPQVACVCDEHCALRQRGRSENHLQEAHHSGNEAPCLGWVLGHPHTHTHNAYACHCWGAGHAYATGVWRV